MLRVPLRSRLPAGQEELLQTDLAGRWDTLLQVRFHPLGVGQRDIDGKLKISTSLNRLVKPLSSADVLDCGLMEEEKKKLHDMGE